MAKKKRDGFYKRGRFWWDSCDPITQKPGSSKCTNIDAARARRVEREHMAANPSYAASKEAMLGEWADKFLELHRPKSAGTKSFNDSKVKALLATLGRERKLATICSGTFDDYVPARRKAKHKTKKRPPNDYTIRRELQKLVAILRMAKRAGCYYGELDALIPEWLEGRYSPRERALSVQEINAFLAALPTRRWRAIAVVCFAIGCRLSEACKLRKSDIDLDNGVVYVSGTKTRKSDRGLPILSPFRQALIEAMSELPIGKISNVDRTFKIACERAKIEKCSPNDLRRTHATLLGERGVDLRQIRDLLGHETITLTKRTYNQAEARRLGPLIEAQLAAAPALEISTESLRIDDSGEKKGRENTVKTSNNQRPPEPKVAGSNLAWRARNSPENEALECTGQHGNTRRHGAVLTNRRQSPCYCCGSFLPDGPADEPRHNCCARLFLDACSGVSSPSEYEFTPVDHGDPARPYTIELAQPQAAPTPDQYRAIIRRALDVLRAWDGFDPDGVDEDTFCDLCCALGKECEELRAALASAGYLDAKGGSNG